METITKTLLWIIGILLLVSFLSKRRQYYRLALQMPTVWGLPFLGMAHKLTPIKNLFPLLDFYFKKLKTPTYLVWIGLNPFIVTTDPKLIESVLTSNEFLNKSKNLYKPINNAIHDGIISSPAIKWQHNRKLMNASFTHKILTGFLPIFHAGSQTARKKLAELAGQEEQPVFDMLKRLILAVAIETTLGIELEEGHEMDENLIHGFNYLIHKCAQDAIFMTVNLEWLTHTPKYYRTINFLRDYVEQLISQKLRTKKTSKDKKLNDDNDSIKKSEDIFIDQAMGFMENGKFTVQDIISETHTMIAGSFETVSTTIYSALVMLAMHPAVQQKLYNEVVSVFPSTDVAVEFEDLKKLPYLDMVINETLRLMPSIPVIGRHVVQNVVLDDMMLPKDMQIIIPIFNLHRRKDIWGPTADEFNPENFLTENITDKHPYAFIPFSKGVRNCIGWRYAYIAVRVFLIGQVQSFRFSTSFKYEDLKFVDHISIKYDVEPMLKIEKRY